MDEQTREQLSPAQSLLKAVAGLAGVLAVASAGLSIAGFFVLRTNADLLGLSTFLHHSVTDYLYVGGAFIVQTFFLASEALLSFLGPTKWVLVVCVTLYFLLDRFQLTSGPIKRA